MAVIAAILTALVAASHFGFLAMEMFFWDHPFGRGVFKLTPEFSAASKVLAANQGLYNGFLAAGLTWALIAGRRDLKVFFLGCVIVAGLYGGYSVGPKIYLYQALPAALALLAVLATRKA